MTGQQREALRSVAACGMCGTCQEIARAALASEGAPEEAKSQHHKLKLTIEEGGVYADLICPEAGCLPGTTCSACGRDIRDSEETERCYDCPTGKEDGCWLALWDSLAEYLTGKVCVTVDIDPDWGGEAPELHLIPNSEVVSTPEEARDA